MTHNQSKLIYSNWFSNAVIFIYILFIFSYCTNVSQVDNVSSKLIDTTSGNEQQVEPVKIVKDQLITFISAESRIGNNNSLKYLPNYTVNWEDFIIDSLKPESKSNLNGLDLELMEFGDFPWNTYSSRSVNTLMSGDTFNYYAINKNKLSKLRIDSLEAEVTYNKGIQGPHNGIIYSGKFIGYSENNLEIISFIIQSNKRNILDKSNFIAIEKENISILKENNQSESYKISLKWDNNEYHGYTDESTLIFPETTIIQFENSGNFLLTSWMDDGIGHQCENYYKLYVIENGVLKELAVSNYNCDI